MALPSLFSDATTEIRHSLARPGWPASQPASPTRQPVLAQRAAAAGYAVLPCAPGGKSAKSPLIKTGFHAASSNSSTVTRWWRQWPRALAGLACSSFWVLDIDIDADDGTDATARAFEDATGHELAELERIAGLVVSTPRGGRHLYFARIEGIAVGTRTGDIALGVDTRGHTADGRPTGYILAPGNELPDGRRYRVVSGSPRDLRPAPEWLIRFAMFNKTERAVIVSNRDLAMAIDDAPITTWRAIFDQHQTQDRTCEFAACRPITPDDAEPLRRQALADLAERSADLAGLTDGRKRAVFAAAAALGKYATHGALTPAEITAALMQAWAANGAMAKHGPTGAIKSIRDGLARAVNDPVPIVARHFREVAS